MVGLLRNTVKHPMKKKVFVVYSSEDSPIVKPYFVDVLEKECGVTCTYYERDFISGKPTVASVAEAIKKCHKIFIILTPNSVERQWVKYEMLLALEKSQQCRRLCVTLFLFKVGPDAVRGQLFGVLSDAMMVTVNPNKDNWQDRLKQDMLDKLAEDAPMCGVNIAVNLSVGQAWSHFTGYGRIVLPLLRDRITSSQWYKQNPGRFPVVEFNLIPDSAQTVRTLNELDTRIKGHLDEIIAGRGSFGDRPYKVSVYSICDVDGTEYFFVAQIPNTLSILSKLEAGDQAGDQVQVTGNPTGAAGGRKSDSHPCLRLSRGERSLQVARFTFIYNRLVNHPKARDCNNMVVLLPYNDKQGKAGDVLLRAIKKQLNPLQVTSHCGIDQVGCVQLPNCQELETMSMECAGQSNHPDYSKQVIIDCLDTCNEDLQTVKEIEKMLINNGYSVRKASFGKSDFQNMAEAMQHCKWAIFVISKTSLQDPDFPFLHFKFRMLLSQSVEENEVRVIPIADGIKEDQVSNDIRAVTYLSKQEPEYLEKLLHILNCESISMECTVTAQDVSQGLAWAYVLNYLNVTLKNRTDQFDRIQLLHPDCEVYRKMFIIIPSSCATRSLGSLDRDPHGKLLDPNFVQLKDIQYNSEDVGGTVDRKYQLVLYKITTPTKNYIVAVEYPNSVLCLQEMSKLFPLSGLYPDDLWKEASSFKQIVQDILNMQCGRADSITDLAELLYYDDSKFTVAEAMLDVLQNGR